MAGTVYLTQDHLGSTRLVTKAVNGQPRAVGCPADVTANATCYYEGNPDAVAGALGALQ